MGLSPRRTLLAVSVPDVAELAAIDTVGVVEAGNVGNGIAQVAAMAGYDVLIREIEQE